LRLSLGRYNTAEEVDYLIAQLPPMIAKLREAGAHASGHGHHHPHHARTGHH
jgi:cysteine sulfinate desulfinase/cysteine desulfurase-like protein